MHSTVDCVIEDVCLSGLHRNFRRSYFFLRRKGRRWLNHPLIITFFTHYKRFFSFYHTIRNNFSYEKVSTRIFQMFIQWVCSVLYKHFSKNFVCWNFRALSFTMLFCQIFGPFIYSLFYLFFYSVRIEKILFLCVSLCGRNWTRNRIWVHNLIFHNFFAAQYDNWIGIPSLVDLVTIIIRVFFYDQQVRSCRNVMELPSAEDLLLYWTNMNET